MKKKLVVFHPALAPYRIDFFNSLSDEFNAKFYFEFEDALEQSFKQEELKKRLNFFPNYLSSGFFGIKNLRLQVLTILKNENPDIVFCCEFNILGFLILFSKLLSNKKFKIVTICDDSKDIAMSEGFIKRCMRSILVKLYDGIVLTNNEVISWYKETFQVKNKLFFFPIIQKDLLFRDKLYEALPITKQIIEKWNLIDKKILLYVGRLIDIKNLYFLLDIYSELILKYPDSKLLLVGEGNLRYSLEKKVKRLGIEEHVIFLGKKEGIELYAYYNVGQIFILPSYYERFGAVVNEALLSGCHTLCSSLAGASCLIQEFQNGYLFYPYNKEDLFKKLDIVLNMCEPLSVVKVKNNLMSKSYNQYMNELLQEINSLCER